MSGASTSAIVVDGASNAQRGSSRDVRPNSRQQDTPVSLAMRITAAVIVVLIVINVLVFAYASIVSTAEPPLRELTDPPGGQPHLQHTGQGVQRHHPWRRRLERYFA
ncbi:hypothetical protein MTO96_034057 [Rhipicephalus appendiculatus]